MVQLLDRLLARESARSDELARRTEENLQAWNNGGPVYARTQTVGSFERSLKEIAIEAKSVNASLILVVPPRRTAVETRWPWAMEYTAATIRVAASLQVPVVDVRSSFRNIAYSDEALFMDDYHPNIAGHQLYAKILTSRVDDLVKAPGGSPQPESRLRIGAGPS